MQGKRIAAQYCTGTVRPDATRQARGRVLHRHAHRVRRRETLVGRLCERRIDDVLERFGHVVPHRARRRRRRLDMLAQQVVERLSGERLLQRRVRHAEGRVGEPSHR